MSSVTVSNYTHMFTFPADPGFSDVYASWAEVLSALGRTDEAAKMTARSLKLAPAEVVYTENLIGSVQNLPATASVVN